MGMPLRKYLSSRRGEVVAELRALRAELREIRRVEATLGVEKEATPVVAEAGGDGSRTLKGMAVAVLTEAGAGLTAHGIIAEIAKTFGQTVARESLSPQLSRLSQDGKLVRHGRTWFLPELAPSGLPTVDASELQDESA